MPTKKQKYDFLTEEERSFLEANVWSSVDEAFNYAVENRAIILTGRMKKLESLISAEKLTLTQVMQLTDAQIDKFENITAFLIHFKMTVDDWMAIEHNLDSWINEHGNHVMNCSVLLFLKKMNPNDFGILREEGTTKIKRLSMLLIEGRINGKEASQKIMFSAHRAFKSLTADDITVIRQINWSMLTGLSFDPLPKHLSVDEILELSDLELSLCTTEKPEVNVRPNSPKDNITTQLFIAAENGYSDRITELAKFGAEINALDENGATSAFIAAKHGHVHVLVQLAMLGANMNLSDKDGKTPAYIAAQNGHYHIITILAAFADVNLNIPNKNGVTPAYIAAQAGHVRVLTELAQGGADLNIPNNNGATPALIAAWMGHKAVIIELERLKASLNTPDKDGGTAIFAAAQRGHADIVKLLLNHPSYQAIPLVTSVEALSKITTSHDGAVVKRMSDFICSKLEFVTTDAKISVSAAEIASIMGHKAVVDLFAASKQPADTHLAEQKKQLFTPKTKSNEMDFTALLLDSPKKTIPVNTNNTLAQTTLGDGNCAYNGIALFLSDCFLTAQSADNADLTRFSNALNQQLVKDKTPNAPFDFTTLFKNETQADLDKTQKFLAPVLRQMVVDTMRDPLNVYGYEIDLIFIDPKKSPAPSESSGLEYLLSLGFTKDNRSRAIQYGKPTLIQYGEDHWFYGNSSARGWKMHKLDFQTINGMIQEANIDFTTMEVLPNPRSMTICNYIESIKVHTHGYKQILLDSLFVIADSIVAENAITSDIPEAETFLVHEFINQQLDTLHKISPGNLNQLKAMIEIWWNDEGFASYLEAIEMQATGPGDRARWGSSPEFNVLGNLFQIKIHLSWNGDGGYTLGVENNATARICYLDISGLHWTYHRQKPVAVNQDNPVNELLGDDVKALMLTAAAEGKTSLITSFANRGINVNTPNIRGATPQTNNPTGQARLKPELHDDPSSMAFIAARMGHDHKIAELIEQGLNPNIPDEHGMTLACIAAEQGHVRVIVELAFADADLNIPNKDGETPVFIAAQHGHEKVIRALRMAGVNMDKPTSNGMPPVYIAIQENHIEVLKELATSGADLTSPMASQKITPIFFAVLLGRINIVRFFLNDIPYKPIPCFSSVDDITGLNDTDDVNMQNRISKFLSEKQKPGQSTLSILPEDIAFIMGHQDIVELFKASNASKGFIPIDMATLQTNILAEQAKLKPELHNDASSTAFIAARMGHDHKLAELIEQGLNPNTPDEHGMTLACIAAEQGHAGVIAELACAGADLNIPNKDGATPAFLAALNDHIEVINALAAFEANLNTPNQHGMTPIYIAALAGNLTILTELANQGVNVNTPDNDGNTPAWGAAHRGHTHVITELARLKANLNTPNNYGNTPTYIAAKQGNLLVITELARLKADLNTPNKQGATPIFVAAREGHIHIVKCLLNHLVDHAIPFVSSVDSIKRFAKQQKDATAVSQRVDDFITAKLAAGAEESQIHVLPEDIAAIMGHQAIVELFNVPNASKGFKPIDIAAIQTSIQVEQVKPKAELNDDVSSMAFKAARKGSAHKIAELKARGVNLNTPDETGKTLACIAAKYGHADVIAELGLNGADLNIPNKHGETPAFIAARHGHADVIHALVMFKADINTPDNHGNTPVFCAVKFGNAHIVSVLAEYGADLNTPNNNKMTPALAAAGFGNSDVIRALEKGGVKWDAGILSGATPICYAAMCGQAAIIGDLVRFGVNIDTPNNNGCTPVFLAAQQGHAAVICELAKQGANIDAPDNNGRTPAFVGAQEGHAAVICELAKQGANIDAPDNNGHTPAHIGAQEGHAAVICELAKQGANIDAPDNDGATPAYMGAHLGRLEVITELARLKANLYTPNKHGATPLFIAAQQGHIRVVEFLLNHPAYQVIPFISSMDSLKGFANRRDDAVIKRMDDFIAAKLATGVEESQIHVLPEDIAAIMGHQEIVELFKAKRDPAEIFIAAKNGDVNRIAELHNRGVNLDALDENGMSLAFIAAGHGHVDVIDLLASFKANLNTPNKKGHTPATTAVAMGQIQTLIALANHGVNLNALAQNGYAPAHIAVVAGQAHFIPVLASLGVNLNIQDKEGNTPAFIAAFSGRIGILTELARLGADLNIINTHSANPMFIAAQQGHLHVVQFLLSHPSYKLKRFISSADALKRFAQLNDANVIERMDDFISSKLAWGTDESSIEVLPEEIAKIMGHHDIFNLLFHAISHEDTKNSCVDNRAESPLRQFSLFDPAELTHKHIEQFEPKLR